MALVSELEILRICPKYSTAGKETTSGLVPMVSRGAGGRREFSIAANHLARWWKRQSDANSEGTCLFLEGSSLGLKSKLPLGIEGETANQILPLTTLKNSHS